jgi:hypothetical protein
MFYAELKNFLIGISSPEFVSTVDAAVKVFDAFEIDDYMIPIDAAVGENSHQSSDDLVHAITEVIEGILDSVLNQHGVFVNTEASLRNRIEALNCLNNVQHWEDKESIKQLLQLDDSPTEKFAMLVELVCGTNADNVMCYLVDVEPGLISKLDDYTKDDEQQHDLQEDKFSLALMNYQNWKAAFGNKPGWSDKFIVHRGSIGLPLQIYLDNFTIDHTNYLDPESLSETLMKGFCEELLTVSCLSEEGIESNRAGLLEPLKAYVSSILPDLSTGAKMNKCLMDTYMEQVRAKS